MMRGSLTLNVSPIVFADVQIKVGLLSYESSEQFSEVRRKNQGTHHVRREGDRITVIALKKDALQLGDSFEQRSLKHEPRLVAALAREALVSFGDRLGKRSMGYSPIVIPGGTSYLSRLKSGEALPTWLIVRTKFLATIRGVRFGSDELPVAIFDAETQRVIDLTCDALLGRGVDLTGLYVGRREAQEDARLAPRFRALGRVHSIEGQDVLLTDTREDEKSIPLDELELDPNIEAFERCLSHEFGQRAGIIRSGLDRMLVEDRLGPNRLQKLRKLLDGFARNNLELVPGVPFSFGPFLTQSADGTPAFPAVQVAPSPLYSFDYAGQRMEALNSKGLNLLGPLSRQGFSPSKPRICVVFEKSRRGQVEQFLRQFKEGMRPQPGKQWGPYQKGFARTYHLQDVSFDFFPADAPTGDAYARSARQAIQEGIQKGKWDLAFIQTNKSSHELSGDANPYLSAKALFLQNDTATQGFTMETAGASKGQLAFSLSNMALACYAKLNGVPWLLKVNQTLAHEIVIGLGSASIGEGRFGARERVVGITSVFTGDGNYHLSNLSQAVPIAEYQDALLQSLRTTVAAIRDKMNWLEGDHVRLVFHAFKPMQDREADAVMAVMRELGRFNVEYAFLHVKDHAPYLIFDEAARGAQAGGGSMKGIMAPQRGQFFPLGDREMLLTVTGPKELKKSADGLPRPILLELHRSSTFTDMDYLTKQVFSFASHSWRTFLPAPMPVTVLYSDLVAGLLGRLSRVSRWSPDAMIGRIGSTRWFL